MQVWHATFLGRRRLPRELAGFELEAFFTFAVAERQAIVERRQPALNLGLALQTGFLRMTGRPLAAVGAVPPALWRHLGAQLAVTAPDLASLRVMYRRLSTFYEHQQLACEVLDFRGPTERRSAVRWSGRCVTDWRGRPIAAGCSPSHTAGWSWFVAGDFGDTLRVGASPVCRRASGLGTVPRQISPPPDWALVVRALFFSEAGEADCGGSTPRWGVPEAVATTAPSITGSGPSRRRSMPCVSQPPH